jgi:hypothetical protein
MVVRETDTNRKIPDALQWQRNTFNTCTSFATNKGSKSAESEPTNRTKNTLIDKIVKQALRIKKKSCKKHKESCLLL